MTKVREAMSSNGNNPMDGNVYVGEFVIGGKDPDRTGRSYSGKKKKAITAVQLTEDGKAKRMLVMKVEDFSAQCLQYIFVNHMQSGYKDFLRMSGEDIDLFRRLSTSLK